MAAKPKSIDLSKLTPVQALGFVHQGLQRVSDFSLADAQVIQASMQVLKAIVDDQKKAAQRRVNRKRN